MNYENLKDLSCNRSKFLQNHKKILFKNSHSNTLFIKKL